MEATHQSGTVGSLEILAGVGFGTLQLDLRRLEALGRGVAIYKSQVSQGFF